MIEADPYLVLLHVGVFSYNTARFQMCIVILFVSFYSIGRRIHCLKCALRGALKTEASDQAVASR